MPMGALWQLQGVLEWLKLGHSLAKVLMPHRELVARLIAKGCTRCCELLGHEHNNIVPFSKDQQHWLWQFSDLWQSALANFPVQVRETSPAFKTVCLPSCICFSKNYSILPSVRGCYNFQ
jgi:hypothetical protein